MKRRLIFFAVLSLALGIVITSLFMGQMKLKQLGDCADRFTPLPSTVRRVECSGMTYGFPVRFLESNPSVEISRFSTEPSQLTLNVSSTSELDKSNLLLNIAFWSALSAAVVVGGWYWFSHRDDKKPTAEKPKK